MIRAFFAYLLFFCVECYEKGNCTSEDSSGKEMWFCCDNYEMIDKTCVECLAGYESVDGSTCKPCENGRYGRKCGFTCRCVEYQLCDHIKGCIQGIKTISSESEFTNTPTFGEFNDKWLTTIVSPTMKLFTINRKTSTFMISTRRLTSTTAKPKANYLGLNKREIIIYSIGTGTFAFFILMCSVCRKRYRKIYGNLKRYQIINGRRNNITGTSTHEIPLEEVEGVYEDIDESNMIDNVENLRNCNLSDSDTNSSYVLPNSDDYLTPYQPTNELSDNKSEFSSLFEENHQIQSDHESTLSSSYIIGERSSYLNPYQPIIHSADIHEYLSTHKIDDSGSSESDTQTMGSGYLNPYQPMVPDMYLHEYKSVLKCSDDSDSTMSNACTNEMGVELPPPNQDMKSETDTYEYKSINSEASSKVSNILDMTTVDSVENFQNENDESYVHME